MPGKRQFGSLRKLASSRWQARYTTPTGRTVAASTTFTTKADANRWLALAEADLARGEWSDPRLGQTTLAEWADRWLDTTVDLKPKTQDWYETMLRTHVLPTLGSIPVARIDQAGLQAFAADLNRSGAAPGTVRAALLVVRRVLATAISGGAIRSNPVDGIRKPRSNREEMHFLTPEQVALLAEEIAHPPLNPVGGEHRRRAYPEYGLLVRFAAYTGLRAGEIGALRVGRLDLMRGRVEVAEPLADVRGTLHFGAPKTYQRRTVPIPRVLASELAPQVADKRRQDLVFAGPDGGPIRHGNFYRRHFKPAVRRSGLPKDLRFHDLRHTYAALLIAEGAHPRAMMERLGHSSVTVTLNTYGHLMPGLEERLTEALDHTYRAAARPARAAKDSTLVDLKSSRSGTDLARRRSRRQPPNRRLGL